MSALLALLQEEAGGQVASPFDINGGVIIWTVVIFAILLALLWRLGYPALLRMVEERDALLARARKDIDAEKEKAILALRREAVELSIAAASRVIEANLDTEANRRLVTEFLESLSRRETKQR